MTDEEIRVRKRSGDYPRWYTSAVPEEIEAYKKAREICRDFGCALFFDKVERVTGSIYDRIYVNFLEATCNDAHLHTNKAKGRWGCSTTYYATDFVDAIYVARAIHDSVNHQTPSH